MKKKSFRTSDLILLIPLLFFCVGYILYPLFMLVYSAFTGDGDSVSSGAFSSLFTGTVLQASLNSALLSVLTVVLSGLIGVMFAYIFHYKKIPLKTFFSAVLLIPLATPPLIGVVSFLFLFNEKGLLSNIMSHFFNISESFSGFDGWTAIIVIHVYSFYPLFFLFTTSALKKIDSNITDAAYSMGASGSHVFFKVILPLLIPSFIGASLITFMASMASFSAPFIFGGASRFLTTEIYFAKINGDNSLASSISVLLTVISLMFLILLKWYRSKNIVEYRHKSVPKSLPSFHKNRFSVYGTLMTVAFTLFIIMPVVTLLYLSLIPEGSLMRNFISESLTFENYAKIFNDTQFFEPFYNSIMMSLIAVIITLIIGVSAAYLIAKEKIRYGNVLENVISMPYGIPGTVIALSLILSFNIPVVFSAFTPLVGTFFIIPLAYSIRNIPIAAQSSISGFHSIDPSLEEASKTLGAGRVLTFRKVLFPLAFPSVLNGALLVFINSVGEFVSTILLYTYSTKTISVEIYSQIRMYNTGAAASYGMLLFAAVMFIVYLTRKSLEKSAGGI